MTPVSDVVRSPQVRFRGTSFFSLLKEIRRDEASQGSFLQNDRNGGDESKNSTTSLV